jgi:NADP-dependent 3-hydroxy acid dehydrogenase YdfG
MAPVVIITGASSGIGAAAATIFAEAGYKVGLLARKVSAMEALQLRNSLCLSTDVTQAAAVNAAVSQIEAEFGPTDCLINNADFAKMAEFTELNIIEHQHMAMS